jgi:cytochrome b561
MNSVRIAVMGFLTLYVILTAIIIYGKITPINCGPYGPFFVIRMQHNTNPKCPVQKLNNQLRLLEITGWDWEDSDDRGDDITED